MVVDRYIASEQEMVALGRELAKLWKAGDTVLLFGDLGAGKTTLVRGVMEDLGWEGAVRSPTFNLMQVYPTKIPVVHADLYRVASAAGIGLEEYFDDHLVLVEWPDRLGGLVEVDFCWKVNIAFHGEGRLVTIETAFDPRTIPQFLTYQNTREEVQFSLESDYYYFMGLGIEHFLPEIKKRDIKLGLPVFLGESDEMTLYSIDHETIDLASLEMVKEYEEFGYVYWIPGEWVEKHSLSAVLFFHDNTIGEVYDGVFDTSEVFASALAVRFGALLPIEGLYLKFCDVLRRVKTDRLYYIEIRRGNSIRISFESLFIAYRRWGRENSALFRMIPKRVLGKITLKQGKPMFS